MSSTHRSESVQFLIEMKDGDAECTNISSQTDQYPRHSTGSVEPSSLAFLRNEPENPRVNAPILSRSRSDPVHDIHRLQTTALLASEAGIKPQDLVESYDTVYRTFRSWIWELLSVLLAIGLLAAISAILVWYDGKPTPDWGTQLNLNAFLALLSTVLRALLVIIASQIVSQRKWQWFSTDRKRPLSDLHKFDSGSRSNLGALLLMPTVMIRDALSLIAAAVLLVSFLIGPFVQQASRTTQCLTPSSSGYRASVPYAHYIPRRGGLSLSSVGRGGSINGSLGGDPTPDPLVAVLSSITAPNGTENLVRGDCFTGMCTFNSPTDEQTFAANSAHSTVAMCDKCLDVSSLSQHNMTALTKTFTLPSGLNVTGSGAPGTTFAKISSTKDLEWLGDLLDPEFEAASKWAYVTTTFLTVQNKTRSMNTEESTAAVCILYPCVRTYTAYIVSNGLHEEELPSQIMQLSRQYEKEVPTSDVMKADIKLFDIGAELQYSNHYAAVKSPCQFDDQVYEIDLNTTNVPNATSLALYQYTPTRGYNYRDVTAPESCIYRQDVQFVMDISRVLNKDVFSGSCSLERRIQCGKDNTSLNTLSSLGAKAVLEMLIEGERGFSNVEIWFRAFATSMTNRFRIQYGGAAFDGSIDRDEVQMSLRGEAHGIAWETKTCVSAHRRWLILPICLTTLTTFLMMWTVIANWRTRLVRPVWKDHILPLLFYRQNFESQNPDCLPWGRDDGEGKQADRVRLMETSELEKISDSIMVSLEWSATKPPYDTVDRAST